MNEPGTATRRSSRGAAGLALRVMVICLLAAAWITGSLRLAVQDGPEAAGQWLRIKLVALESAPGSQPEAGGSLMIEAGPAMAGREVQLSIFGPLGGANGPEFRDAEFFGVAGVQVPWLRPEERETEVALAAASGARSIGMDFEWNKIEPEPGQYDWKATDEAVRLAKKYHLKIVPMLMYTPEWASKWPNAPLDSHKSGPVEIHLYRDFVYQVVNRYKPGGVFSETQDGYGITDWVMWNEPNVQGAESDALPGSFWIDSLPDYIQLLRAGYEGAHAADPSCNVLNGGLADVYWRPGQADVVTALERLYDPNGDGNAQDGGRAFFDTLNLHIYPPGRLDEAWYKDRMDAVARVMQRFGDETKKVWITETGLGSSPGVSPGEVAQDGALALVTEDEQAQGVELAYRVLASYPQVERVFWWSLRNYASNNAKTNPAMEAHYGLLTVENEVRPAYLAYMRIASRGGLQGKMPVLLQPSGQTLVTIPTGWVQEAGPYLIWVDSGTQGEPGRISAVVWTVIP